VVALLVLLAAAVAVVLLAPRTLAAGRWQVRMPRLALGLWLTAVLGGVACLIGAGIVGLVLAIAGSGSESGAAGVIVTVFAWMSLLAVGGTVVIVASGSAEVLDAVRRNRGSVLTLPHTVHVAASDWQLLVCDTDEVFACAIPGKPHTVAVSAGLVRELTPAQLRAVVAHERAHLSAHHELVLRLADLNLACMPRSGAAQRLRRSTSLLIELAADDAASRRAGAVHLANALVRVGRATGDVTVELRAERLAQRPCRLAGRLTPVAPVYERAVASLR